MSKAHIAAGLDAGATCTRCVVIELDDALQLHYRGHGEIESIGWSKGRIGDQSAVSACMEAATHQAETEGHTQIDAVVLGVGGSGIAGYESRGVYEFGRPREVTQEDIQYAIERAANVRLEDDRCMLQLLPQDFTLNGRAGYRHPRGSVCKRLEANVYIITAASQEHDLLVGAAHQAHLAVEETLYEPVAAAYACVLPDDRGRGVAVIDIGSHSTDMAIYDGEALLSARHLPVAADHFTRDVAFGLKAAYEDAEKLKVEYGCAILGLTADNSIIEVPSPEGRAPREAQRKYLNFILESRAEQLFEMVQDELKRCGMDGNLLEGVVLTGGGALLNGMCDVAERILNCQSRNGLPAGIDGWPDELSSPAWTTAAGLAMYSARLQLSREEKKKAPGLIGLVLK